MPVSNKQLTVKKIYKNLENKYKSDTFKPHWTFEFTDGTKAKLKLEQENFNAISPRIGEGGSALFTIEDGEIETEKGMVKWYAIRDIIVLGQALPSPAPSRPLVSTTQPAKAQDPVQRMAHEMPPPVNGQALGNRRTNSVNLVIAQIGAGVRKATDEDIRVGLDFWDGVFLKHEKGEGYQEIPF